MKLTVLFLLSTFILLACSSPMNHRVKPGNEAENSVESMSFKNFSFDLEVQWLTGPFGNLKEESSLLVTIKDQNGLLQDLPSDLTLNFYSTMPSMGHPLDDPGYFEKIDTGLYINKSVRFNMPGDWKHELWIMDSEYEIKDKVEWNEFF